MLAFESGRFLPPTLGQLMIGRLHIGLAPTQGVKDACPAARHVACLRQQLHPQLGRLVPQAFLLAAAHLQESGGQAQLAGRLGTDVRQRLECFQALVFFEL